MHTFLKPLLIQENKNRKPFCLYATCRGLEDLIYFLFPGWGPSTLFDDFSTPNTWAFAKITDTNPRPLHVPSPLPGFTLIGALAWTTDHILSTCPAVLSSPVAAFEYC